MIVWFSGLALAAPVNCDVPTQKTEIERLLSEAEVAVGALDSAVLTDTMDRARALALCVETELQPPDIARLYRLSGISWYVGGDLVRAAADFEVAKALDPDAIIDPKLGRPLRMTYDAVSPPTGETKDLPPPSEGWVDIDGIKAQQAPVDRGFFLQWVGSAGDVRGTWLLSETDAIPYPMGAPVVVREKSGRGLLVTGIVGTVLGAGAIAGAAVMANEFEQSTEPSSELDGLVTANRVLGYGGIGLGVAGLGLVGASFAVGF